MLRRAVCSLALLVGCAGDQPVGEDKPAPDPLALPHTTASDVPKTIGFIGVLTPRDVAEVTAPFTTKVDQFFVNLGDHVEKGTRLAHLDEQPLQQQLTAARAELRARQAEISRASSASSAAAQAYRRDKAGLREGVASRADVADAAARSNEAAFSVSKAIADADQQKDNIATLTDKLAKMTLTAPIAGQVALRYVEDGARVEEGKPVIRVISSGQLFVRFAIPTDQVGKVSPNDLVDVQIEGRPGVAHGVVTNVSPELDSVAQMILAEAELTAPVPDKLQPGMVAHIIATGAKPAKPAP